MAAAVASTANVLIPKNASSRRPRMPGRLIIAPTCRSGDGGKHALHKLFEDYRPRSALRHSSGAYLPAFQTYQTQLAPVISPLASKPIFPSTVSNLLLWSEAMTAGGASEWAFSIACAQAWTAAYVLSVYPSGSKFSARNRFTTDAASVF